MMAMQRGQQEAIPLRKGGPYTLVEKMDPKRAEAILAKGGKNRHLRDGRVEAIARDIANGRWLPNPQPISISPSGRLLDGQHRLHAIVKAGKAVTLFVAYNVPDESMDVIDRGAGRTIGDVLNLHYDVASGRAIAAICMKIHEVEVGGPRKSLRATTSEIVDVFHRFEKDVDWAFRAIPTKMEPGIQSGGAAVRAAFAFMRPISPDKVERLAARYVLGEGASEGVVRAMRAAAVEQRNRCGDERWILFAKILRGIEAHLTGERVHHLKFDAGVVERVKKLRELAK